MDSFCKEMHGVTDFINSNFNCLQENDNGIVFKKLHFETRFHKFAFSGPPKHTCHVNERPKTQKKISFFVENSVV